MASVSNPRPVRLNLLDSLRGFSLAKNSVWNVLGQLFPLLIAAVAIPLLIRRLGVDRFGVLTLAWTLVGYFSLFDLGLGRSLTKVASDRLASGREHELSATFWTAITIMAVLGSVLALALCIAARWLAGSLLKVPPALFHETQHAIYPLAVAIPFTTATTGFRGLLEAQHRFGMTNAVRAGMGVFNFLGPLVAALFSPNLFIVILVLVLGRCVAATINLLLCFHTTPNLKSEFVVDGNAARELLSIGGWITVSNLVSPIMVYLDRFLIGALLSVSAVAYYTTPFELVGKLWIVPTSITAVLFPAFAALSVMDKTRLAKTYAQGVRSCFVLIFPAVFLISLYASEGLRVWLGPKFMQNSTPVVHWLVLGLFINSLAQFPFALLQAADRPDLPGKLHLVELPLYLIAVSLGIRWFGLPGAAFVWSLRVGLEGLILFVMVRQAIVQKALSFRFGAIVVAAVLALLAATLNLPMAEKLGFTLVVAILYLAASWWIALEKDERQQLRSLVATTAPSHPN